MITRTFGLPLARVVQATLVSDRPASAPPTRLRNSLLSTPSLPMEWSLAAPPEADEFTELPMGRIFTSFGRPGRNHHRGLRWPTGPVPQLNLYTKAMHLTFIHRSAWKGHFTSVLPSWCSRVD